MKKGLLKNLKRAVALAMSVMMLGGSVSMDALAAYPCTLSESECWEDFGGVFKGTAFGNIGSGDAVNPSKCSKYIVMGDDGNGDLRINVGIQKGIGKMGDSAGDGFAMYYYQIPADATFSFTATVEATSYDAHSQGAFGLMLRDNMVVDTRLDNAATEEEKVPMFANFIAAGTRCKTGENGFARINTTDYESGGSLSNETLTAGGSYILSIESTDAGYKTTFGSEEPVVWDNVDLSADDECCNYLCLFASRRADVTYTDINLVVNGETIYTSESTEGNEGEGNGSEGEGSGDEGDGSEDVVIDPAETNGFIQTTPYEGVTYTFDFTSETNDIWNVADGESLTQWETPMKTGELGLMTVNTPAKFHGIGANQHGTTGTMNVDIAVAGNSKISILGCKFGSANTATVTSNDGGIMTFPGSQSTNGLTSCAQAVDFYYLNDNAGSVNVVISGGYTHGIVVTPLTGDELAYAKTLEFETSGFNVTDAKETGHYVFDFTSETADIWEVEEGEEPVQWTTPMKTGKLGLMTVTTPAKFHSKGANQHGSNGALDVDIAVAGNSKISIFGCKFSNDTDTIDVSSATGIVVGDTQLIKVESCGNAIEYLYVGDAGSVNITNTGGYIHGIKVSPLSDEEVPNLALAGYTASLEGNIAVNFYTKLSDAIIADENAYVQFTLPNGDVETVMTSDAAEYEQEKNGLTYHVFTCEVSSFEMTKPITMQLVDGEGNEGTEYSYTVREYADYIISAGTYTDEEVACAKALLNYGACAQEYFEVETEDLANKNMESADQEVTTLEASDLSAYKTISTGKDLGMFKRYNLVLKSETTIKVYFLPEEGVDGSKITFYANDEEVAATKSGDYYVVALENISSNNLDTNYSFKAVCDGYEDVSYECSALTYGYSVLRQGTEVFSEELIQLVSALRVYQVASDALAQ